MTLEDYFKKNLEAGVIDHAIRASKDSRTGTISFYIHAMGVSSDTLDFEVRGDSLRPREWAKLAEAWNE